MFSWLACTTLENQPHFYAKRDWLSRVVLFSILLCGLTFHAQIIKTPRSISPIGNVPARAATQTRPAPSWHEQCAIRQVFTYVHCVHMRSAIPLMYTTLHSCILNRQFHEYYIPCIPPTFTDPNCLRPTPIQFLLTVQQLVTPACYPGPAECAKRLNKMICHSIISPLQPQLHFARVCTSRLVNKCSSIMNRRNARSDIWRTLSLTTWPS